MANIGLSALWTGCLESAEAVNGWTVVKGEETPLPAGDFWFQRRHFTASEPCSSVIKEMDDWLTMMQRVHPEAKQKVVRVSAPRWRLRDPYTGDTTSHLMEGFALVPPSPSIASRVWAYLRNPWAPAQ